MATCTPPFPRPTTPSPVPSQRPSVSPSPEPPSPPVPLNSLAKGSSGRGRGEGRGARKGWATPTQDFDGAFLQFNFNGVQHCRTELASFISSRNIQFAWIQESKLSIYSQTTDFSNYYSLLRDRPDNRGGKWVAPLTIPLLPQLHQFPYRRLFPW